MSDTIFILKPAINSHHYTDREKLRFGNATNSKRKRSPPPLGLLELQGAKLYSATDGDDAPPTNRRKQVRFIEYSSVNHPVRLPHSGLSFGSGRFKRRSLLDLLMLFRLSCWIASSNQGLFTGVRFTNLREFNLS